MIKLKKRKCFTFIELIYCFFVFSLMMMLLFGILKNENNNNRQILNEISINQDIIILNNKVTHLINTYYGLSILDNTLVSKDNICLIDFNVNSKNGILNYIYSGDKYYIEDKSGNVIADNLTKFIITEEKQGLIRITYAIKRNGEEKEQSEIFLLNKILY